MPDIFLRSGEANPADVKLRDTTLADSGAFTGTGAITQAVATLSASGLERFIGTLTVAQAPAILAGVAREAFRATGTATQAAASLASVASERFIGQGAIGQSAAILAATGSAVGGVVEPVQESTAHHGFDRIAARKVQTAPVRAVQRVTSTGHILQSVPTIVGRGEVIDPIVWLLLEAA